MLVPKVNKMKTTRLACALVTLAVLVGVATKIDRAAADQYDRRVEIENNTSYTIVRFYASSVGQSSWQEDILGQSVIPPYSSVVINIDDGTGYCLYDFRAEFDDGEAVEDRRVNVCELGVFSYDE